MIRSGRVFLATTSRKHYIDSQRDNCPLWTTSTVPTTVPRDTDPLVPARANNAIPADIDSDE